MKDYWMQHAFKKHTKGATHRMLGVPKNTNLPFTFLRVIMKTPLGEYAHNPTNIGKARVKVTWLLKKRAGLALTSKRISRGY